MVFVNHNIKVINMLNFFTTYYEVTEQNKELLRKMIIDEDIRDYNGNKFIVDLLKPGQVLGNNYNNNPKYTGIWSSRNAMWASDRKKITTHVVTPFMEME